MPLLYGPTGEPIEIAEGRGDLRFSSTQFDPFSAGFGLGLIGGRTVSYADLFASQTWVAAAVMRMLTWAVRVPLKAYRRTGDDSRDRLRPDEHPIAGAITSPWERGSQASLTMSLLGSLLVHGNGLTEAEQGARDTLRWNPVDWRTATPIKGVGASIGGWRSTVDGKERTLAADTTMHTAWWSPLGPLGISPLQQLGVTLSIEDGAQRYQQSIFRSGARPPSAIKTDKEFLALDGEVRDALLAQMRADIAALYSGPDNAGKPALLPPGLEWQQIGHTAVEAELIDQRKVAREEVAAVYQIPPPSLGIYDRSTFSNIEASREMAYTDGLAPPLVLIEQTINANVIRGLMREDDVYVEYDFGGVLRGDRLKEMESLREAVATAVMTPNESRSTLNLPRSDQDGMDDFYLPANNLSPVGTAPDSTPPSGGSAAEAA